MQEKVKVVTLLNEETNVEDKYALSLNPIGEGKYAKVYKAVNMKDPNKIFAVKVIKIQSEEIKKQYLKELKIIKNLPDCPNLVKTHKQHLESQNNLYIFQQYCQSGTLVNFRTEKYGNTFTEDEIYDLFFQVSNGLITLLGAGIIHQDIKPVNILKKGLLFKLCDFGVSEIGAECKQTTTRKGTISYMPPQKLKSKKFLPNQKSDIYSLGTCIYQIIFGFHPYLKKKTSNYKEYLVALEQATLRPTSVLMKKIGSSSLRLENFLNFLERMIDLSSKTRVNIQQLRQFIQTTQPFMTMRVPQEQKSLLPIRQTYSQNFININESVIRYKTENQDNLHVTSPKQSQHSQYQMVKSSDKISVQEQPKDSQKLFKQKIRPIYIEQNTFVVDVLGFLIRGINYIRKSNFADLNVTPVKQSFLNIDLKDCMFSRYLKYLIFEFSIAVRKRFKERYEFYIEEQQLQNLDNEKRFLDNEFNKFLIQSNFQNKAGFAKEISQVNTLKLWKEISQIVNKQLQALTIVKSNKKEYLLSVIYCVHIPKLLELLSQQKSIFSNNDLDVQYTEEYLGQTYIQDGKRLLDHIHQLQGAKIPSIQVQVQKQLQNKDIQVLLEIEEESGEIEIIEQQELI